MARLHRMEAAKRLGWTKIKRNDIGFKNARKLSHLPPKQQEDAAGQLAAGDLHSVDEYQPIPAEQQNPEQRET